MIVYRQLSADPPVVVAQGTTRQELFEHAALAMSDIAHDLSEVPPTYSRPVIAPGDRYPELLRNWLDELLFVADREGLVWSSFAVDRLEEGGVQGSAAGMPREGRVPEIAIVAVDAVPSGLVPVPDGWWAEIHFRTAPAPVR